MANVKEIIKPWIERFENLLEVQRFECLEYITARYTRPELVSMLLILRAASDLLEKETDK